MIAAPLTRDQRCGGLTSPGLEDAPTAPTRLQGGRRRRLRSPFIARFSRFRKPRTSWHRPLARPIGLGLLARVAPRALGLDVDQDLGVAELRFDRVPELMGELVGPLQGGAAAELDVEVDVAVAAAGPGPKLVVADDLRRPRAGPSDRPL